MLTKLSESVKLKRDCEGVLIPAGDTVVLPADGTVVIKQSLGGDYTVRTDCGDMVRIDGKDADALGKQPKSGARIDPGEPFRESMIDDTLRTVYDPEIPVNIMDLGLVYDSGALPLPGGGHKAYVQMTLTAPGCGMGEVLKRDVERKLRSIPGVKEVQVDLVFNPPWSREMMSDVARLELGLF